MTDFKVGDTVRRERDLYWGAGDEYNLYSGQDYVVSGIAGGRGITLEGKGAFSFDSSYFSKVETGSPWRYNDHLVVYPGTENQGAHLGRAVTVLNEKPLPRVHTRWEGQDYPAEDEITEAARAYFDAHPAPKPAWHDAKEGEVWLVTTLVGYVDAPALVMDGRFWFNSKYASNNLDSIEIESGGVTARRIYPESE